MKLIRRLKDIYWDVCSSNLRGQYYRLKFNRSGSRLYIGKGCRIVKPSQISIGTGVYIHNNAELFVHNENGKEAQLILGDNVCIGKFSCVGCCSKIILEDCVRIAPYVHISDRNHSYEDITTPIFLQPINTSEVVIGRETWIGFGAQIMPGVHIGRHCVIGSGSIVTRDIPDYCVAVGIPAKIVKCYNFESGKWEKVKQ